jgi:type IV pilus assembly protein PilC
MNTQTVSFEYKGIAEGKYTEGIIEALDKDEASFKLREKKVIITSMTLVKGQKIKKPKKAGQGEGFLGNLFIGKVKTADLSLFSKKISTMIKAGLPILDSFKMVAEQTENKRLKLIINQITKDLEAGTSLSKCFAKNPAVFDKIYVNMIKAGEASGKLDIFLTKLTEILERREDIRRKIKSASFYPKILFFVAGGITVFMLLKVVPIFEEMYGGMGVPLPGLTKMIISASNFVQSMAGVMSFVILGLAYYLFGFANKRFPKFKRIIDKLSSKLPIFGNLIAQSIYARVALIMSNLIAAGVSIIETLEIVKETNDNLIVSDAIENVKRGVFSGIDLSKLFLKEPVFPPQFGQLIAVGEKTGNLEEMFISIANYYQEEFDNAVQTLSTAIEPIMIVLIGTLIGFLLLAMYMPIFNAGSVVGG